MMNAFKPVTEFFGSFKHDGPTAWLFGLALVSGGVALEQAMANNIGGYTPQVQESTYKPVPLRFSSVEMTSESPASKRNVVFVDGRLINH